MGEMAEYYMNEAMIQEFEEMLVSDMLYDSMHNDYVHGILQWTTKEGEKILVSKMTDSHLQNTINHLKKKGSTDASSIWIEILEIEQLKRSYNE